MYQVLPKQHLTWNGMIVRVFRHFFISETYQFIVQVTSPVFFSPQTVKTSSLLEEAHVMRVFIDALIMAFFFFFSFLALLLSSFWTTRGHRCRPFSPPVLALNFYRA